MTAWSQAEFYRRLHIGNPGDCDFYCRVNEGAKRTLELGCGWGRILEPLSSGACEVWGVERSEEFVKEARAALGEPSAPRILLGDITKLHELELPRGSFDRILLPYNVLYALGGPGGVNDCLLHASPLLHPKGELWADVYPMDAYQAAIESGEEQEEDDDEPVATWATEAGQVRILESSTINHELQHLDVLYRALDETGEELSRSELSHDYLLLPQIEELFDSAGFELQMVLGGFDGRPYDGDAEQLIIGATPNGAPQDD